MVEEGEEESRRDRGEEGVGKREEKEERKDERKGISGGSLDEFLPILTRKLRKKTIVQMGMIQKLLGAREVSGSQRWEREREQ